MPIVLSGSLHEPRRGCFFREVLLTLPSSPGKHDFTWIPRTLLSRQTCAKQGTFLAEAIPGNYTLDFRKPWSGVLRPQQQLPEEAPDTWGLDSSASGPEGMS